MIKQELSNYNPKFGKSLENFASTQQRVIEELCKTKYLTDTIQHDMVPKNDPGTTHNQMEYLRRGRAAQSLEEGIHNGIQGFTRGCRGGMPKT